MRLNDYNRLAALSRRSVIKGAAGAAALALASGGALGAMSRAARAQANLRAEILKIPGVGMGSPTDADWQKVGEMCLGGTRETVPGRRVRRGRAHLHGAQQPEPAQLPVPRLPQALGDLHRREDQLDRPRPGRLQRPAAAVDRHRHRRLRRDRDGRAVRGRRLRQGPRLGDARLGRRAHRHGRLRQLPEGAGRDLGRQDLPHLDRRRLPHLLLPHRRLLRPDLRRGVDGRRQHHRVGPADHLGAGAGGLEVPARQDRPDLRHAAQRLPRSAQGLGRLRLLLPRGPRHRLRQVPGRAGLALRPRHHEAAGQQPGLRAGDPGRPRHHGHPAGRPDQRRPRHHRLPAVSRRHRLGADLVGRRRLERAHLRHLGDRRRRRLLDPARRRRGLEHPDQRLGDARLRPELRARTWPTSAGAST